MCHYATAGMAFRDWPVDQQEQADALSGIEPWQPIQAFLVSLDAQIMPAALCVIHDNWTEFVSTLCRFAWHVSTGIAQIMFCNQTCF